MKKVQITQTQFDAIAKLLRMSDSPSREAARLVLVEGLSGVAAAQLTGALPSSVSNAVTRCRKGFALAQQAAGLEA